MIAILFIYLWLYDRTRVYATLGTYQNRRPPCTENRDDTVIIFSDKPTISLLPSSARFLLRIRFAFDKRTKLYSRLASLSLCLSLFLSGFITAENFFELAEK